MRESCVTSAIPYLVIAPISSTSSEAGAVEVAFSAMLPPLEIVGRMAVLFAAAVRMEGEESKGLQLLSRIQLLLPVVEA